MIIQSPCRDTPVGKVSLLVSGVYASGPSYNERVTVTIRANYAYPGSDDLVFGTLPKKITPFKVNNLVVKVDGYKAPYIDALKQALDRKRLQSLIDQPLPETPPVAAWSVQSPGQRSESNTPTSPESNNATSTVPGAQDVAEKAINTVNKLRGIFGR